MPSAQRGASRTNDRPTDREHSDAGLMDSEARALFLASAGTLLISSLDYDATVTNAAEAAIPLLADWCAVDLQLADGRLERVAMAYAGEPLGDPGHVPAQAPGARIPHVLRTGESEMIEVLPREAPDLDGDVLVEPKWLGLCSWMAVPLRAHGRVIGAMSFGRRDAARCFGVADLALAEDLARQAGPSIDDAWHYREAQRAIRLRDDVLGTVAHDLKTPLTSIKGNADLLLRLAQASVVDPERVRARAEAISTAAAVMSQQIGELVDAARLEAGQKIDLVCQPTDLAALATRMAKQVQAATDTHTIEVECVATNLVGVWDGPRLERVVGNLLSNAVQYSPGGGAITMRVAAEEDPAQSWAVLEVQDHGMGIPAADLPRIFERYHRGRNVAGSIPGTGIGLAGAKQIVEQHGGRIDVRSVEGQGSAFTVRLPLSGA